MSPDSCERGLKTGAQIVPKRMKLNVIHSVIGNPLKKYPYDI